jgi:hypothetical protein
MTKVQENLIVKWLDGQLDDTDAMLLIQDWDAENMRQHMMSLEHIKIGARDADACWVSFEQMTGKKALS